MKLIPQNVINEAADKFDHNVKLGNLSTTKIFKAGVEFAEFKLKEKFPNGITSYLETYYEIVSGITESINLGDLSKRVTLVQGIEGRGGLYELAEKLTNAFELLYKDKEWNGDYFDTIDEFLNKELYN